MTGYKTTRRDFIKFGALAGLGAAHAASAGNAVPSYLHAYKNLYRKDPRAAALQWFADAKFGLFIHYGLYSLLGRHEWVQLRELIPVAKYGELQKQFTAEKFDPGFITDLALAAQMRYINITTRHHDSFCLFRTRQTPFNSVDSPAKRDLVGELAKACRKKGLGLFLYYSHGRDWKHPHAPNNDEWGGQARPKYNPPEPSYAYGKDHDLQKYVDFMTAQITELLTQYGPVAGIWLDGIATTRSGDTSQFHVQQLYDLIHRLQPQVLVSYKQGLLGTEDFLTPEHKAVENKAGKPMEINTTLQVGGWGYVKDARHLSADQVMEKLAEAARAKANLLLNTGPLGDGSIHPEDVATLREVGARIRKKGFPSTL
ncbi:MAG TPA: alpha-L-fucosidase [Acidobacteriota bacterium]|jgi:alpha-L-fucosidase|nr:alpha-L-fucosidase [Acidobacteriota bacterium]